MPNEGDKPGACCEGMEQATQDRNRFSIRWCTDEMTLGDFSASFTGWGILYDWSNWYGDFDGDYAPVKFCPFCGKELKP